MGKEATSELHGLGKVAAGRESSFSTLGRSLRERWARSRLKSLRRARRVAILAFLDGLAILASLHVVIEISFMGMFSNIFVSEQIYVMFCGISLALLYLAGVYYRSWRFFDFASALYLMVVGFLSMIPAWGAVLWFTGNPVTFSIIGLALAQALFALAFMMVLRGTRRSIQEYRFAQLPWVGRREEAAVTDQPLALLVGSPQWARSVLDLVANEESPSFQVAGVLLPSVSDPIARVGKAVVLGSHDMLTDVVEDLRARGRNPSLVIVSDDSLQLSEREMARLSQRARDLGMELLRIRDGWSQILLKNNHAGKVELNTKALLGRSEYKSDGDLVASQIEGECILTTGAGGTIGGELCWQIASFSPSKLILVEHSEFALYSIERRLRERYPDLEIHPELCDIRNRHEVRRVFAKHRPSIVFHAAALKHVPMVEANPCGGVLTNILGTRIIANAVCEYGARAMVQVSTDKAVNPVGMMGATKRVGELYSQSLDRCGVDDAGAPRFMTVRFGNVLGSSGSILPLLKKQLEDGKPLTITHPDIERFFMTVHEAVQLILQSSSSALEQDTERGTIFVLDMGKPVRIVDLAHRLISLYGLEPELDVPIDFIGLRPGEKLYEELFDYCEDQVDSRISGIFEARSRPIPLPFINSCLDELERVAERGDDEEAKRLTHHLAKISNSTIGFEEFCQIDSGLTRLSSVQGLH
ncbi:polysaccharide biosynthesis protein [Aurantiacibacter poecillastricola]|uniref:polysaccharide biosynthesis protein n=1 Tax=Aurantiacibacter poecillastricola TaxID=3064385 RepID=UPI00273E7FB4|nr:polysaccharide biosynthesis protein [Aurantiacibacter sp. 219JJ12-13]MDP5259986.1 polysaccharide biosynthesis protein [Aurantiacibacter sp. 219JJ12-13]